MSGSRSPAPQQQQQQSPLQHSDTVIRRKPIPGMFSSLRSPLPPLSLPIPPFKSNLLPLDFSGWFFKTIGILR